MPKRTFFNLPGDKRRRIVEAAIDEFASTAFEASSISKIVDHAGIAKGSFYQYFDSKEDLFGFVLEEAGRVKHAYLGLDAEQIKRMKATDVIRELYAGAIAFARAHPKLASIGNAVFRERRTLSKLPGFKAYTETSVRFFADLIRKGIEEGDVRNQVNPEITAVLLIELNFALVELFLKENTAGFGTEDLSRFETLVDHMLDIVKNGIDKS